MKCKDCKWWEIVETGNEDDKYLNICRRHSPRPATINIEGEGVSAWSKDCDWVPGFVLWPITGKDDWCGEFEEKKEYKAGPGSHA